jgi:hypothetical protein
VARAELEVARVIRQHQFRISDCCPRGGVAETFGLRKSEPVVGDHAYKSGSWAGTGRCSNRADLAYAKLTNVPNRYLDRDRTAALRCVRLTSSQIMKRSLFAPSTSSPMRRSMASSHGHGEDQIGFNSNIAGTENGRLSATRRLAPRCATFAPDRVLAKDSRELALGLPLNLLTVLSPSKC